LLKHVTKQSFCLGAQIETDLAAHFSVRFACGYRLLYKKLQSMLRPSDINAFIGGSRANNGLRNSLADLNPKLGMSIKQY
jgi:hypothetical protein